MTSSVLRDEGRCSLLSAAASDATSLLPLCCRASVSHSGQGILDVAPSLRAPRDEGRSCRCRPFDLSYAGLKSLLRAEDHRQIRTPTPHPPLPNLAFVSAFPRKICRKDPKTPMFCKSALPLENAIPTKIEDFLHLNS